VHARARVHVRMCVTGHESSCCRMNVLQYIGGSTMVQQNRKFPSTVASVNNFCNIFWHTRKETLKKCGCSFAMPCLLCLSLQELLCSFL
jgi:hypothetical protein